MSLSQKNPAQASNLIVNGECFVQISSDNLPIVSRSVHLVSGFVVLGLPNGNRKIVSKSFINFIAVGPETEIREGEAYNGLTAFKIAKGKVRTVDDKVIEGNEIRNEEDFIIIYMPDNRKFIIRKDLVKEIEEILAGADQDAR